MKNILLSLIAVFVLIGFGFFWTTPFSKKVEARLKPVHCDCSDKRDITDSHYMVHCLCGNLDCAVTRADTGAGVDCK